VALETQVTETGVLELWCVSQAPPGTENAGKRWKLEFQVRESKRK
jgi:hypothetical protein